MGGCERGLFDCLYIRACGVEWCVRRGMVGWSGVNWISVAIHPITDLCFYDLFWLG